MSKSVRTYLPQYPHADYQRKWRAARGRQYDAAYAARNRLRITAEKLRRGRCIDCGLTCHAENVHVFDFDHRDPGAKRFTISRAKANFGPYVLAVEMAKCDLRCSNCHRDRTMRERHWVRASTLSAADDQGTLF